eukprot:51161-Pyramimonas_sp.AAC.1
MHEAQVYSHDGPIRHMQGTWFANTITITGYQRQRCSRFPEAWFCVSQAGSSTQGLSIFGPLATPVYCEGTGG